MFRAVYHAGSRARAIVLLHEVDRSLSLSHAALIAHRSLIYRAGEGRNERAIKERIEYNIVRFILPADNPPGTRGVWFMHSKKADASGCNDLTERAMIILSSCACFLYLATVNCPLTLIISSLGGSMASLLPRDT